jgi:NADPH-dependent 2,4-dienoyl-CoA reductase/sulfur reductase-like enzyme
MGDRLLVIGGDAAGMAAAAQARRRSPTMEIVAVEKGRWTSYSACGIPYLVGGDLQGVEDLVARRPDEFRAMRIDVRMEHEATAIDLAARKVEVHNRAHGRTFQLGFDLLHVATGARPHRPALPGLNLPHVHGVQTLDDTTNLLADARARPPRRVVVVGSGYIGLELAEAYARQGVNVTVLEAADEVMGTLDPDMGALVAAAMRGAGITVRTSEPMIAVTETGVQTPAGEVPADLVILGLGVEPDSSLAASAGLDTGVAGAIAVDRRQRTSAEGVWAAGDCCQSVHVVSGRPVHQALGTVANKQGRVAGINIGGGYATFPGVAGTAVTRICRLEIGRTGLSEREAAQAGFDFVAVRIDSTTRASYMPDASEVTVKLLAERGAGRILGAQIAGGHGAAKRVDVIAAATAAGMTAEDVVGLDLGYAPPFSSVWDPVQVAARRAVAQLSAN